MTLIRSLGECGNAYMYSMCLWTSFTRELGSFDFTWQALPYANQRTLSCRHMPFSYRTIFYPSQPGLDFLLQGPAEHFFDHLGEKPHASPQH